MNGRPTTTLTEGRRNDPSLPITVFSIAPDAIRGARRTRGAASIERAAVLCAQRLPHRRAAARPHPRCDLAADDAHVAVSPKIFRRVRGSAECTIAFTMRSTAFGLPRVGRRNVGSCPTVLNLAACPTWLRVDFHRVLGCDRQLHFEVVVAVQFFRHIIEVIDVDHCGDAFVKNHLTRALSRCGVTLGGPANGTFTYSGPSSPPCRQSSAAPHRTAGGSPRRRS